MAQTKGKRSARGRRRFTEEFKREAVQMLLDEDAASSVAESLGVAGANLRYRWKQRVVDRLAKLLKFQGLRAI